MGAHAGSGVVIAALDITSTASASCSGITRAVGGASVRTGASGATMHITNLHDGSGAASAALVATFTACASTSGGLVRGGTQCDHTGICTVETITTTVSTVARSGRGAGTDVSVCTCTDCELCIATTKDTGAESDLTGTCGAGTIITSARGGFGEGTAALAATSIVCVS